MSSIDVVNFLQARVDLRRDGASIFLVPDFSSAIPNADGVIAWDPKVTGVLGGLVHQDASGDHGGERHLDGDELIVAISGSLTIILLDDEGRARQSIPLAPDEATLVPCGSWHRLETNGSCRYFFFGGGRTEIRRSWTPGRRSKGIE